MNYVESLAAEYRRLRDHLLSEYPELADDAETLADTLEGESSLPDALARLVRDARHDKAMADALGVMIAESRERQERLNRRAETRRNMVLKLMSLAGLQKLEQPDFTASIRNSAPKVIVADEEAIPTDYCRITTTPDKTAIKEALKAGKEVAGAFLSNAEPTIALRFK